MFFNILLLLLLHHHHFFFTIFITFFFYCHYHLFIRMVLIFFKKNIIVFISYYHYLIEKTFKSGFFFNNWSYSVNLIHTRISKLKYNRIEQNIKNLPSGHAFLSPIRNNIKLQKKKKTLKGINGFYRNLQYFFILVINFFFFSN